jgi:hypothetical protein
LLGGWLAGKPHYGCSLLFGRLGNGFFIARNYLKSLVVSGNHLYVAGMLGYWGSNFLGVEPVNRYEGFNHLALLKLDLNTGAVVWKSFSPSAASVAANDIAIDSDGYVYLFGSFKTIFQYQSVDWEPNPDNDLTDKTLIDNTGVSSPLLMKFRATDGKVAWATTMENTYTIQRDNPDTEEVIPDEETVYPGASGNGIAIRETGTTREIYVTGTFTKSLSLNKPQDPNNPLELDLNIAPNPQPGDPGESTVNGFVAKYTDAVDGQTLDWAKGFDGVAADIALDAGGNIGIAGTHFHSSRFGIGGMPEQTINSYDRGDMFFARYDENGNFQYVKPIVGSGVEGINTFGGSHRLRAQDYIPITLTFANNSFYLTGDFRGMIALDCTTLSSEGRTPRIHR